MANPAGMPRLVIKEMVLDNFKSYVGEQRIGPFHKSFSSVVGPNGSGKSNVIDALLFVFGKKAKQLRLNKVSELIHNSSNHQNLPYARVTVYFHEIVDHEHDEGYDAVPNSDLTVAREAYRDNTSKYYLNGKVSNFTEVTKVLKGKGVDLDNNRFLILQGEVELISMMKPKAPSPNEDGLLEYLEDIIGTNQYVEPISEAAKRLEELNEQRTSQVQRLKVTEKEKDGLSGSKAEAEEFISKERELLRQRGVQYQLHVALAQANVTKLREQKEELEAKLTHERKKQRDFEESVSTQQATFAAEQKLYSDLCKELQKVEAEFKEFERKDVQLREDLKAAKAKFKKSEEKHAKSAAQAAELREGTAAMELEVPQLEQRGAQAEQQLEKEEAKLDAMLAGLRSELEALGAQLAKVQEELAPWEQRISEASARADVAAAERGLLVGKREAAQARLKEAREGAEGARAEAEAREAEAKRSEKDMGGKRKEAAAARKEEAAAREREAELRQGVQAARGKAEELRRSAREERSQSGLLAALMQAKSKGQIPGIHGRLGDLGAIDAKYDVAVSMAGGGALDNIVVETTADAQKCVELLRKNSLGVATFLILEKQAGLEPESRQQLEAPEGVPRLIDLVRPAADRLRVAFYYALRNTAVAKDIEQASRIAYGADKRFRRVVTIDGKLIESSGTMSGGGATPKGGRMRVGNSAPRVAESTAELEKTLAAAEKELEALESDLRMAVAAAEEAGRRAADLEKAAAALERALPKLAMEAESLRSKAADLQSQLASLEAAAKAAAEDDGRLKVVEKELAAAEKALAEVRSGASSLHAKAAKLQKQMTEAGGPQLKAARAAVAKLQEEIDAFTSGAAQKRATIAANTKQAAKLEKTLADSEKERARLQAEMEAAKAELRGIEEKALDVQQKVADAKEAVHGQAAKLESVKAQHKEVEVQLATIRSVEEDIKNSLEETERNVKENDKKAKHWDAQLAKVRRERAEAEGLSELPALCSEEELAQVDDDRVAETITLLESELASMKPDMGAIAAWQKKEEEYCRRVEELRVVTEGRDGVKKEHDELRKRRLEEFMAGFEVISLKLKEMYQMITLGGDAELELVDSLDPFSEGIVFSVRPPKKSWKHIANLSGGEKTLSSLALVFALHHYKPTPLYVMDEIDAALDFKNVSIVAHYIKERTKNAQFVIISLRNNMFELADRLVGIYKTDNATKSITINPGTFGVSSVPPLAAQQAVPVA